VVPKENVIDPDYLYFVLKWAMRGLSGLVHGATMKHVTRPEFEGFEIQIAKRKEEQCRIAARLKAQLAEVETARSATESQLLEATKLATLLRDKVFGSLEDAKRVPLGEILLGIEAGRSFQTSERLAIENELGVLEVSAVSWSEFRPSEAKAIDGVYLPDARHRVISGDILISRANTVELVGAVVRVDEDYPNRLLSDKTLRLVPDTSKISPDYLVYVLRLPEARSHIQCNATGTSDSMRNISQKTIATIPIPVPKLWVQQGVAKRLSEIELELGEMETPLNIIRSDIMALPAKLLAQAFETNS
jgi:type I restriction enzyme, S subunit